MAAVPASRLALNNLISFVNSFKASQLNREVTHTLLTKPYGKFSIPLEQMHQFRALFHNALLYGSGPGFVEIKPKGTFRLFVDLDIKLNPGDGLQEQDKLELVACIHKTAITMFGSSQALAVSCTPYRAKSGLIKSGIHIVWPSLFVSHDGAAAFRQACIVSLNKAFDGRTICLGDWADVIDDAVYREGTGLRMIGAAKQEAAATVYLPDCRLDEAGALVERVKPDDKFINIPDWLEKSSLCAKPGSSNMMVTAAPRVAALSTYQRGRHQHPPQRARRPRTNNTVTSTFDENRWLTAAQCPELVTAVRGVIADGRAADFRTAVVKGVWPYTDSRFGACALIRLDTKRCINLYCREYHNNNHTYLVVQGGTAPEDCRVCQRCHSERKTETRYGACKTFNLDISMSPARYTSPPALISIEQQRMARANLPRLLHEACVMVSQQGPVPNMV